MTAGVASGSGGVGVTVEVTDGVGVTVGVTTGGRGVAVAVGDGVSATVGGTAVGVAVGVTRVGVGVSVDGRGVGVGIAAGGTGVGVGVGCIVTANSPSSRSTRTPYRPLGLLMVNPNGTVAPAATLIGCTASIVSSIHSFAG